MAKSFAFAGARNFELRWDVFNVFNTVNFTNPGTRTDQSTYGVISGARIPRQMQFILRFSF